MDEKQFKEAAAALMKDRSQREALAQMIIEYVQPNHVTADIMNMIISTRTLSPGDTLVKKMRKGMRVLTWVPGSMSLKSEITVTDRINHVLDSAIIGVMANEWELEAGEIGTVASIKAEALMKLKDYYINKAFTALTSVWTAGNTPSNFTNVGGAITATALEDAINRINQTTPRAKAIVGVRSALTPITKFGAFWNNGAASPTTWAVDSQLEEVMRTGWLGQYFGVPIIAVNQVYDNPQDHNALLPTNRILVIGENVGEFITYGAERVKEWTDNEPTPPYWHMDIVQQFGLMIDNCEGIYSIQVA
jgi:hypothetical protein